MKKWLLLLWILVPTVFMAQRVAVKTNMLYDLTSTLNVGVEYRLSPRWTVDLSGNYNPFEWKEGRKMKHWLVQPEVRYWFCEAFAGHFVALHALGGEFNVGDLDLKVYPSTRHSRYEGGMYGAGVGYGYQFVLGTRWNLGLEIGGGWIHANYDRYNCAHCGDWKGSGKKNYLGLTKAAVSLIYIIR